MTNKDNWDEHWSQQDVLGEYNPGQIFRHGVVKDLIASEPQKSIVMDFGSGQGDLIKKLSQDLRDTKFYGLEYSEIGVSIAKKNNPDAHFVRCDLTENNLAANNLLRADIITCCDVLEHIDNPVSVLDNAYDMLNSGGLLIITLPGGPMSKLDEHIGHRFHYNTRRLNNLLAESKFGKYEVSAIGWPFFNLYRLMLILRGSKLVGDVSCSDTTKVPLIIKLVGTMFKYLFRFNINSVNLGWQMLAVARK